MTKKAIGFEVIFNDQEHLIDMATRANKRVLPGSRELAHRHAKGSGKTDDYPTVFIMGSNYTSKKLHY